MLLVAAGSASAIPCPAPGNTNISTSCELTQNWNVPAGQYGYKITANNVVIDGYNATNNAWYSITSSANGCTAGMWGGNPANQANPAMNSGVLFDTVNNCVLKNMEIEGFCTGVVIGLGMSNTVENCTIHDNGGVAGSTHGVHLAKTHHNTITESDIYDNLGSGDKKVCGSGGSGNGIFLFGGSETWGNWNKFTHNNLTNNTKAGYFSKYMCSNNEISYNKATENGLAGIVLRAMSTYNASVHDNNASNNCGVGIYIRGNQGNFWNNTVCNNMNCSKFYPGILPPVGYGCGGSCADCGIVSASQIAESGGCGIKVESGPGTNDLHNNTIYGNEDWDIYDDTDPADQAKLTGDDNTCNVAFQYRDISAAAGYSCHYQGSAHGVDLIVINKSETWYNATHYTITYTVMNIGTTTNSVAGFAGVWIDNVHKLPDCPVPALPPGITHTCTSGPHLHTGIVQIMARADITDTTDEGDESNNCTNNTFGGPDLKVDFLMTNWTAGDPSLKNFSMDYKIKNIGDITASNVNVKFCFCSLTHTTICSCINVPIGNLGAGSNTGKLTVGQYKLPDPMSSYIKCMVDCPVAITENNEHNNFKHVQHPGACYHACGPCASGPGGCGKCLDGGYGDVNSDPAVSKVVDVSAIDYEDLFDYVVGEGTISCKWAGDVNCENLIDSVDYEDLFNYVLGISSIGCCPGGCP